VIAIRCRAQLSGGCRRGRAGGVDVCRSWLEWCDAGWRQAARQSRSARSGRSREKLGGADGAAPGRAKSAGAVCAAAGCSSRSRARIVRVRLRQRLTSSRAIRTCAVLLEACERGPIGRARRAVERAGGTASSSSDRAGASAAAACAAGARRSGRRGGRPAASAHRKRCSPGRGDRGRGSRSAARATASASIGSDLPRARRTALGRLSFAARVLTDSSAPGAPARAPGSAAAVLTAQERSPASGSPRKQVQAAEAVDSAKSASASSTERPSATPCARPLRSRSFRSPLQRWGRPASGRPHLRPAAKLPIRSRSGSREGGGDTTLESQPSGDVRE